MRTRVLLLQCAALGLFLALAAGPASAEVYRCVGPGGRTLYSDAPCPHGSVSAREISQQVGACVTDTCAAKREAQTDAALRKLQQDKTELARMQELRVRQEEAWLKATAAQREAEAAAARYAPQEDSYGAFYPLWWFPQPFFSCRRHHFAPNNPGCMQSSVFPPATVFPPAVTPPTGTRGTMRHAGFPRSRARMPSGGLRLR
ncbi:MAG TPA: DUF4124 domain-containing protein [Burkholderiales bacterium]|nr:DUF4124 domain-containing protein [Burkholderiales bacterium]